MVSVSPASKDESLGVSDGEPVAYPSSSTDPCESAFEESVRSGSCADSFSFHRIRVPMDRLVAAVARIDERRSLPTFLGFLTFKEHPKVFPFGRLQIGRAHV